MAQKKTNGHKCWTIYVRKMAVMLPSFKMKFCMHEPGATGDESTDGIADRQRTGIFTIRPPLSEDISTGVDHSQRSMEFVEYQLSFCLRPTN